MTVLFMYAETFLVKELKSYKKHIFLCHRNMGLFTSLLLQLFFKLWKVYRVTKKIIKIKKKCIFHMTVIQQQYRFFHVC